MLIERLQSFAGKYHPVVPFDSGIDKAIALDLSDKNTGLTPEIFLDTPRFDEYIQSLLAAESARYGYGGYLENRSVYARSRVFDAGLRIAKPRTLHLGLDVWGDAGTEISTPLDATVHSTGYHPDLGNYGATIVLQHQLEGIIFYTLYGHVSKADLACKPGDFLAAGTQFAHFGQPSENGHWPPHLHFQIIHHLHGQRGDYPGVCALEEVDFYKQNCPDPRLMITFD